MTAGNLKLNTYMSARQDLEQKTLEKPSLQFMSPGVHKGSRNVNFLSDHKLHPTQKNSPHTQKYLGL